MRIDFSSRSAFGFLGRPIFVMTYNLPPILKNANFCITFYLTSQLLVLQYVCSSERARNGKRPPQRKEVQVIAALAECNSIRAIERLTGIIAIPSCDLE